jgi:outer membrane biosynthesis protein TonB
MGKVSAAVKGVKKVKKNLKKKTSGPKVNTKPKGKPKVNTKPKSKPKVNTKPKAPKKSPKPKQKKKQKSAPKKTPKMSWWQSATKGVSDISNAMGVGGRAFKRSIKNKPIGKLPTKVATHVGKHPGKYATGSIIGAGVVGKRQGTAKGRRQASHDLKI